MEPSQCIKIGNSIHLFVSMYKDTEWLIFGTVRHFSAQFLALWDFFEKVSKDHGCPPPARLIITPTDNEYACGYFITRADIDMTWCYVKRLCNSLEKLIRMYKNGQKTYYELHIYIQILHEITYKREYIITVNSCSFFLSKLEEMKSCIYCIKAAYTWVRL